MLSKNDRKQSAPPFVADAPQVALEPEVVSASATETGDATDASVQGDVGRLVKVAAELFALIEAQVEVIAHGLTATARQSSRAANAADVKDEILQSASNLDTSLQSIRHHLRHEGVKLTRGHTSQDPSAS